MDRRQKDIVTMAEHAELAVVCSEKKNGRQYLTAQADNGVKRTFSISLGSRSDARGDLNELSDMKRFARENRSQEAAANQPLEAPKAPEPKPAPVIKIKPARKASATTMSTNTARFTKAPAVQSLSHADFYRVCEWVKGQDLARVPSLEALAMLAGQHLGSAVPEDEMTVVMNTIGISEPQHWADPTEPNAILARELLTIMKKLGESPSPAFKRLADSLLA
ncbi:hypothetical protein ACCQ08_03050 [Comamonas sp. SY3]|uniref:hypothetical protein n=1 Tax=Comamonas sp. SY3 TaxID=3243601 RepID=UPI003594774A